MHGAMARIPTVSNIPTPVLVAKRRNRLTGSESVKYIELGPFFSCADRVLIPDPARRIGTNE